MYDGTTGWCHLQPWNLLDNWLSSSRSFGVVSVHFVLKPSLLVTSIPNDKRRTEAFRGILHCSTGISPWTWQSIFLLLVFRGMSGLVVHSIAAQETSLISIYSTSSYNIIMDL